MSTFKSDAADINGGRAKKDRPSGRPQFHCDIGMSKSPVSQQSHNIVNGNRAGIVAVKVLVKGHILCLCNAQPDGTMKPDDTLVSILCWLS